MNETSDIKNYSAAEERINILSHAVGLVLSFVALIVLIVQALRHESLLHFVSFSVFGCSLIVLYAASTTYHKCKKPGLRKRLRVLDHASIYVLIAGTYTPFTLITLSGVTGWTIFSITWLMAVTGIILKLFYTGKFITLSTLMYICMGWMIIFAINPLIEKLSPAGMKWLVAGGLAYTAGAILYGFKKIRYTHAIFHIFVLLGSACHFVSVAFYI